jgi:hypothetical protein
MQASNSPGATRRARGARSREAGAGFRFDHYPQVLPLDLAAATRNHRSLGIARPQVFGSCSSEPRSIVRAMKILLRVVIALLVLGAGAYLYALTIPPARRTRVRSR